MRILGVGEVDHEVISLYGGYELWYSLFDYEQEPVISIKLRGRLRGRFRDIKSVTSLMLEDDGVYGKVGSFISGYVVDYESFLRKCTGCIMDYPFHSSRVRWDRVDIDVSRMGSLWVYSVMFDMGILYSTSIRQNPVHTFVSERSMGYRETMCKFISDVALKELDLRRKIKEDYKSKGIVCT